MSETSDLPNKPDRRALAVALALVAAGAFGFAAFSKRWLYHRATQLQYHVDDHRVFPIGPVHEIGFGLGAMYECPNGRDCDDRSNAEFVADWRQRQLSARYLLQEPVDEELADLIGADALASLRRSRITEGDDGSHVAQLAVAMATKQVYSTSAAFVPIGWIALVACIVAALSLIAASALVLARKRLVLPIMPTTIALLATALALVVGCVFVALKPGPSDYVGVSIGFFVFAGGVLLSLWSSLSLNRLLRPLDPDLLEDAMDPDHF